MKYLDKVNTCRHRIDILDETVDELRELAFSKDYLEQSLQYVDLDRTDTLSCDVVDYVEALNCLLVCYVEESYSPFVQHQRRLNLAMKEVVKAEVLKLLDVRFIYVISNSP